MVGGLGVMGEGKERHSSTEISAGVTGEIENDILES